MNFGQRSANGFSLVKRSIALPFRYPKIFFYSFIIALVSGIQMLVRSSVMAGMTSLPIDPMILRNLALMTTVVAPLVWLITHFFIYAGYQYILGVFKGKSLSIRESCRFSIGRFFLLAGCGFFVVKIFFFVFTRLYFIHLISPYFFLFLKKICMSVLGGIINFVSISYLFHDYGFGASIQRAFSFVVKGIIELLTSFVGWFIIGLIIAMLLLLSLILFDVGSPSFKLYQLYYGMPVSSVANFILGAVTFGMLPLFYSYLSHDRKLPSK